MHCPFCSAVDTKVIDSRLVSGGDQVRRRRECLTCAERFTTFASAELVMPRVIKSGGAREPFNEDKLRAGLARALEKRPVSTEQLETILNRIQHDLRELDMRHCRRMAPPALEIRQDRTEAAARRGPQFVRLEELDSSRLKAALRFSKIALALEVEPIDLLTFEIAKLERTALESDALS